MDSNCSVFGCYNDVWALDSSIHHLSLELLPDRLLQWQDWQAWKFNPYFLPAAAALFIGFAVFMLTPVRSWTDALWNVFLTLYAMFTGFWVRALEHEIYDGCPAQ
mmetsp:Transcript_88753/g.153673  ORF Transcript_88753/g.153673 Transcript_88753/m.153673 type:complete len:105 (+) Transcript_88753:152-466(+)